MIRRSLTLMVLFTISFIGFVGYSYLTRPQSVSAANSSAATTRQSTQHVELGEQQSASVIHSDVAASETNTAAMVDKWIAETTDDDPTVRAAAIAALASAPRLQAIPALRRVLTAGEPVVDRPLALRSLHTLALQQGDADGGIRDVLRQAIYHVDDEATTQHAQATLDDVEAYLNQGA